MNNHVSGIALQEGERIDTVNERLRLIQRTNGLTYGTDAYLLAAFVRPMPSARAVDLGSGTGIIPLLLATKGKVQRVAAVEIQETFAELIARNAALNGFADRIDTVCADVRELHAAALGGEVDLVVSNPPYMRTDSGKRNEHEEKYVARHEVHGSIADFCAAAGRILKHGGRFACVWRPDRMTELLRAMQDARLEPKRMVFVHADGDTPPSMLLVEAVKGGAPSVRILPPLLLHATESRREKKRPLSLRAQKIYDTCQFED